VEGGYYGHPNPKRQEYILNGGNPTGEHPAVVAKNGYAGYPVGTSQTQTIMASLIILVGTARPTVSLNTRGQLWWCPKNKLLVAEYSGGDDLIALAPGTDGNILVEMSQVISGLTDPLDLIEDTKRTRATSMWRN